MPQVQIHYVQTGTDVVIIGPCQVSQCIRIIYGPEYYKHRVGIYQIPHTIIEGLPEYSIRDQV